MTEEQRSYVLPDESMRALDLSDHRDDLARIQQFLEAHGIATRNTRIERYVRYLEAVIKLGAEAVDAAKIFKNSAGPPFVTSADWHLYVLREVHELMWILKGLQIHLPRGVDEKLRLIVGGRDFAALDTDSHSRNAQFELRIASYFCQAGCSVDVSTDTDVVALSDDHVFCLECKRVGSRTQLAKRLSEARTQLAQRMPGKHGKRLVVGCIAADVTKVAFSHNGLTFGLTNGHSRDVIHEKLVQIAELATNMHSFESCRMLLSYWLQIHISALIMMPPPATFATRFSSYHIARPRLGRKDAKALLAFHRLFESVSIDDNRASPPRIMRPRTSVQFSAGDQLGVEADRILKLLEQRAVTEAEYMEIIGTLTRGDEKHEFTFVEVAALPQHLIEEWKEQMSVDRGRGYVMLLGRLYMRRYPYEEPEHDSP